MLEAIEQVHNLGYIHRDIKPANFALGQKCHSNQVYMIDFGLAKRQQYDEGAVSLLISLGGIPVVKTYSDEFKGTLRYASMNAHKRKVKNGRAYGRICPEAMICGASTS